MKMKNTNIIVLKIIILIVFSTNKLYSQKDSTILKNKKNEIGLNIGPILLVTLGSSPYSQPINITYKRVFNRWAFRTNVSLKPAYANEYPNFLERIKINDSTLLQTNNSIKDWSFAGRIGIEYRYQFKRGWSFVTGLDIVGLNYVYSRIITQDKYKIDTVSNSGTALQFYNLTPINQKRTYEEKITNLQFGLGLTLGTMIPLGKNWLILGQLRLEGTAGSQNTKSTDFLTNKSFNNKSSVFNFNTGATFTELSLFYKF